MDSTNAREAPNPAALVGIFVALFILYSAGNIINTLYFHPLHNIPGPKINAVSRIPYIRHMLSGTTRDNVMELHKKYGDVVRVSPNEISFISGETAWQDIYGFRVGQLKGQLNMQKDPVWYPAPINGTPSILVSGDEAHSRGRRVLSHAFSEKALAEQEPLLIRFVDLLVDGLKDTTANNEGPQDMTDWYNWATFDIITDLLFGEPLGCLQDRVTHKYVGLVLKMLESFPLLYTFTYLPWVKFGALLGFIDTSAISKRIEYHHWIYSRSKERMEQDTDRPDFMSHILKHNGDKGLSMSQDEINSNCQLFVTAGSETTATLLSGVTFLLLKNPSVHQKLKDEVRSRWKNYSDITIEEVNKAPYLLAVLSEALRYFPPVPTGFPRQTPPGGAVVSGHYIPEKTSVYVSSYALGHSERNFKNPEFFVPERWMGDPEYADDRRNAHQPFSFGPRNCLGKNLAYAEMRLILAKIIWSFDLELDPSSYNWLEECKVFALWKKPELAVRVKEVLR